MEFMQLALGDQTLAPNFYESDKSAVIWMIGFFGAIHRISLLEDEKYRDDAALTLRLRNDSILSTKRNALPPDDRHISKENEAPLMGCGPVATALPQAPSLRSESNSTSSADDLDMPQSLESIFCDPPEEEGEKSQNDAIQDPNNNSNKDRDDKYAKEEEEEEDNDKGVQE